MKGKRGGRWGALLSLETETKCARAMIHLCVVFCSSPCFFPLAGLSLFLFSLVFPAPHRAPRAHRLLLISVSSIKRRHFLSVLLLRCYYNETTYTSHTSQNTTTPSSSPSPHTPALTLCPPFFYLITAATAATAAPSAPSAHYCWSPPPPPFPPLPAKNRASGSSSTLTSPHSE